MIPVAHEHEDKQREDELDDTNPHLEALEKRVRDVERHLFPEQTARVLGRLASWRFDA